MIKRIQNLLKLSEYTPEQTDDEAVVLKRTVVKAPKGHAIIVDTEAKMDIFDEYETTK